MCHLPPGSDHHRSRQPFGVHIVWDKILKSTFKDLGFEVYGGDDAPYIFVYMGDGVSSWDKFSEFLENLQVVTTPGAGFGPGGEGYVRLSAFAPREGVLEACERFKKFYAKN